MKIKTEGRERGQLGVTKLGHQLWRVASALTPSPFAVHGNPFGVAILLEMLEESSQTPLKESEPPADGRRVLMFVERFLQDSQLQSDQMAPIPLEQRRIFSLSLSV